MEIHKGTGRKTTPIRIIYNRKRRTINASGKPALVKYYNKILRSLKTRPICQAPFHCKERQNNAVSSTNPRKIKNLCYYCLEGNKCSQVTWIGYKGQHK